MFYAFLIQIFITKHFILERLSIYVAFFSLTALPETVNAPCKPSQQARTVILEQSAKITSITSASEPAVTVGA